MKSEIKMSSIDWKSRPTKQEQDYVGSDEANWAVRELEGTGGDFTLLIGAPKEFFEWMENHQSVDPEWLFVYGMNSDGIYWDSKKNDMVVLSDGHDYNWQDWEEAQSMEESKKTLNHLTLFEKFDYRNPDDFENVDGIDISMTNMRKAVKVKVGSEEVELNKEQTQEIMAALQNALRIM